MESTMDDLAARIAAAPLPTAAELRQRRSIGYQLLRFVAINLRIVLMVIRGHRDLDQPAARP
jgi:hypothetical protein